MVDGEICHESLGGIMAFLYSDWLNLLRHGINAYICRLSLRTILRDRFSGRGGRVVKALDC